MKGANRRLSKLAVVVLLLLSVIHSANGMLFSPIILANVTFTADDSYEAWINNLNSTSSMNATVNVINELQPLDLANKSYTLNSKYCHHYSKYCCYPPGNVSVTRCNWYGEYPDTYNVPVKDGDLVGLKYYNYPQNGTFYTLVRIYIFISLSILTHSCFNVFKNFKIQKTGKPVEELFYKCTGFYGGSKSNK